MKTALDAGNVCGWTDLDAVIAAMESGNAYVNVHTEKNGAGEIRGQVKASEAGSSSSSDPTPSPTPEPPPYP